MAENRSPVRRNDMIHCENCGEDYSATYKRCPFCDEMQAQPTRSGGHRGGGKRVANTRGGGYGGGPDINLFRILGIVVPLALIVAALYIIITVLGPMITAGKEEPIISGSTPPSESVSGAVESEDPEPSPSASEPVVVTPVPGDITGITLDQSDFTLPANSSHKINATITPADAQGTVTWSVDNASAASISQDGTVTNTNTGSSTVTVTVTASSGDVSATCLVRCKPGSGAAVSPEPSQSGSGSSSGTLSAGSAVIANAGTGLRVRSGPGTSYEILASLLNGNQVTIVESAGDGWYKITFDGLGGVKTTGYVLGEYLSQN